MRFHHHEISKAINAASLALATGARWSEAESVKPSAFTPYRVTYSGTKAAKVARFL